MSATRATLRIVALMLLLAGILLLRKPVFSQQPATAPTRFSVVTQGTGPDVILIPGLASSREVYAAEAKLLTSTHRLHLIQIAGFAGEPAGPNASGPILAPVVEQLHQYIAANHLQPVPVIAHSLGGLLALMLAQSHPDDVSKLLIIDTLPFYGLVFSPGATVENLRPQAQAMATQMLNMPADQFAASQPLFASHIVTTPEGIKAVSASSISSDRTVFVNAMLEDLATDLRPQLASIKTPMTLLYPYETTQGSATEVAALYTSAYAAKPNLQIIRIDNSRHFIMYDQPAAFDKTVQTFLKP
jgi:pimeloyl-ACP methyl ester carboxylesterase